MSAGFFLLLLVVAATWSGNDPQWELVSDSETANFASQVLARTFLGAAIRWLFSKIIGAGITTDIGYSEFITLLLPLFFMTWSYLIMSIIASQVFPSGLLLASIALSGYATICFRFVYDLLVAGHGIVWMYHRGRLFFDDQRQRILYRRGCQMC